MSLWDAWFGTPTEKKREAYKALYHDLNHCLSDFQHTLKNMEEKVDGYIGQRPHMNNAIIPEDIFGASEARIKGQVEIVKNHQVIDARKLSNAVDAAYQRYQYYAHLAEQERLDREAAQRYQAEQRQNSNKNQQRRR